MVNFLCQFSVDVLFFWVFYLIPLASWQWKWSSLVHALGWTWPCFSVFNTGCAAALRMITVDSNQWRTVLPTQPNPEVQAAEEWGQRCVERYSTLASRRLKENRFIRSAPLSHHFTPGSEQVKLSSDLMFCYGPDRDFGFEYDDDWCLTGTKTHLHVWWYIKVTALISAHLFTLSQFCCLNTIWLQKPSVTKYS